jgi:peptidylprolyl isomerase
MKRSLAGILAFSLVLLTGCGDKEVSATADNLPTVTTNMGEAPTIGAPSGTPPTTLESKDIVVGTGAEVAATSTITFHYTLMTWSNGALIESSWNSGSPATYPLTQLIVGWQQGIPGMKVGGRRLLIVPPDLGYGAQGSGPVGPNETLIFVMDIVSVA